MLTPHHIGSHAERKRAFMFPRLSKTDALNCYNDIKPLAILLATIAVKMFEIEMSSVRITNGDSQDSQSQILAYQRHQMKF